MNEDNLLTFKGEFVSCLIKSGTWESVVILMFFFFLLLVLGIESRGLSMLDRHSTPELYSQPVFSFCRIGV
jgi:hypothetical protein